MIFWNCLGRFDMISEIFAFSFFFLFSFFFFLLGGEVRWGKFFFLVNIIITTCLPTVPQLLFFRFCFFSMSFFVFSFSPSISISPLSIKYGCFFVE
jgi:hypothetical protein